MRGHFSIEWMAQSSQRPAGTHSESLPGFYRRPKLENSEEQEARSSESRGCGLSNALRCQNPGGEQVTEAGFSTEEETSGYESEGGRSLSSPPSPPSGRRPRTAFTAEQIGSLERTFKRNAYLGTQDKAELCKKLNLSDKQIRNWFQNRRMKLKRSVQDALAHACQANAASHFMHYPDVQAYRPPPYQRYHAAAQEVPPAAAAAYGSPLPGVPSLALDSFYRYGGLQGVMLPPPSPSYPPYPKYY